MRLKGSGWACLDFDTRQDGLGLIQRYCDSLTPNSLACLALHLRLVWWSPEVGQREAVFQDRKGTVTDVQLSETITLSSAFDVTCNYSPSGL